MGDTARDPVDHARTTRQHAGESMKNGVNAPGLVSFGLGVAAVACGLAAFANGAATLGIVLVVLGAVLWAVGGVVLWAAHRRVRKQELRWHARNEAGAPEPPTS